MAEDSLDDIIRNCDRSQVGGKAAPKSVPSMPGQAFLPEIGHNLASS
jgi:hypothetical protein